MTTPASAYVTARVAEVSRLSSSFIRVVFDNPDPVGFVSSDVPDEIVHLYFPADEEVAPPEMAWIDGVLAHHREADVRECRNYTVRHWGADTLTIDFVDHGGGVAAAWARSARPGDQLGMWGTRSWYRPPVDTAWMLLVADLPGIPALLRIVEQLPPGQHAHIIAEVAHSDDVVDINVRPEVTVDWLLGGNTVGASSIAERAATWAVPHGPGYVWFAGEASTGRALRKHFRGHHHIPANRLALVGYWRANKSDWVSRYEHKEAELLTEYAKINSTNISDAEAEVYWDEILEREGL